MVSSFIGSSSHDVGTGNQAVVTEIGEEVYSFSGELATLRSWFGHTAVLSGEFDCKTVSWLTGEAEVRPYLSNVDRDAQKARIGV